MKMKNIYKLKAVQITLKTNSPIDHKFIKQENRFTAGNLVN